MKINSTSNYLVVILVTTVAFFSSLAAEAQGLDPTKVRSFKVKLSRDTQEKLASRQLSKSVDGFVQTGFSSMDKLSTQYKVVSMTRVFRHGGKFEAKHVKYGLDLWYELSLAKDADLDMIVSQYGELDEIQQAEPYYQKRAIEMDVEAIFDQDGKSSDWSQKAEWDDPYIPNQWFINNTGQTGGTPDADVDLFEAWDIEPGSSEVIVAVIDGGVQTDHPDLVDNFWVNEDEVPDNGIDDDNNGYVDDIYGYNMGDETSTIYADDHGTHVGGTVSAVNNNGLGVAGVAGGSLAGDGARIMSLSAFGEYSTGNFEDAFVYAADNGAIISQNSWSYSYSGQYDQVVLDAIDYFIAEAGYDENGAPYGPMQGGIVIFAAGNDSEDANYYPPYYEPVLAVAASDHDDLPASFTNYGDWVDITAPGVSIVSTYNASNYASSSGTSMACPIVSGVAALIVSNNAYNITPEQVRYRLLGSVDDVGLSDDFGAGRLNAYKALQEDDGIAPAAVSDLSVQESDVSEIVLTWTAPTDEDDEQAISYEVRYSTSDIDATNFEDALLAGKPAASEAGTTELYHVTGLEPNTSYFIAIKAIDGFGNASPISNTVSSTTKEAPSLVLTETSIEADMDLSEGNIQETLFTITNEGPGTLSFSFPSFTEDDIYEQDAVGEEKAASDGNPTQQKVGGPDNYGYTFTDSFEDDGPDYFFEDISDIGTEIFTGSDGNHYMSLPFLFPFYGESQDDVWINANGFIAFSDFDNTFSGISRDIPEDDGFNHLIAGLWYDLTPDAFDGQMHVYSESNYFIVQWTNVPEGYDDEVATFQIILYNHGTIRFNYLDIETTLAHEYGVVGIENKDGSDGLVVMNYELDYMKDEMSVEITPPLKFAFPQILSGTVAPNESLEVPILFEGANLTEGVYNQDITLETNDPTHLSTVITVELTVTGSAPNIEILDESLDFGAIALNTTNYLDFRIFNSGNDELTVNLSNDSADYVLSSSSFDVTPFGGYQEIEIQFTPATLGAIQDTLLVETNDPDTPTIKIPMSGTGLTPPEIVLSSTSLSENLDAGDETSQILTIGNEGGSPLDITFNFKDYAGASLETISVVEEDDADLEIGEPYFCITFDGSTSGLTMNDEGDIWVADTWTGTTTKFDPFLNEVETFMHPSGDESAGYNRQISGITYDNKNNTLWWMRPDFGEIVEGQLDGTPTGNVIYFSSSNNDEASGLTYDRLTDAFFYVDNQVDEIYAVDRSGNVLDGYPVQQTDYAVEVQGEGIDGFGLDVIGGIMEIMISKDADSDRQFLVPTDYMGNNLGEAYETDLSGISYFDGLDAVRSRLEPNEVVYVTDDIYLQQVCAVKPVDLDLSVGKGYLSADRYTASVPAGSSLDVVLEFDATGLAADSYTQELIVKSNDYLNSAVSVNTSLIVNENPNLEVSHEALSFEDVIIGTSDTLQLEISNNGNEDLTLALATDNGDFFPSINDTTIQSFSTIALEVIFQPTTNDGLGGILSVNSNDPENPTFEIALNGTGLIAPELVVPDEIVVDAVSGEVETTILTITNEGGSELTYTIYDMSENDGNYISSLSIFSSTVESGESTEIELDINATNLIGGIYETSLYIESNDPALPDESIPLSINVTGTSGANFSTYALHYGELVYGFSETLSFDIENDGTDVLELDMTFSGTAFYVDYDQRSLSIPVGEVETVEVSFHPTAHKVYSEILTIDSNTPDGVYYVSLVGIGMPAPDWSTDQTSYSEALVAETSLSRTLTLKNESEETDLIFSIPVVSAETDQNAMLDWPEVNLLSTFDQVNRSGSTGRTSIQTTPTTYRKQNEKFYEGFEENPEGWSVIDADGDEFSWFVIIDNDGIDANTGIGMAASQSYDNDAGILTPDNYLITPAISIADGDSLHWFVSGQDENYAEENYAIMVSTTGTEVADFTDNLFEETLPAGTVQYLERHLDLSDYAGESIYIAFRHYNVSDQFLLLLDDVSVTEYSTGGGGGGGEYLNFSVSEGTIAPGDSLEIALTFDATGLNDGTYTEDIVIDVNDPNSPTITIPTTLEVDGFPELYIASETIDYGSVYTDTVFVDSIQVWNTGSDSLFVTASFNVESFTLSEGSDDFKVPADEYFYLSYTGSPTFAGEMEVELSLITNEEDAEKVILISANAQNPPIIQTDASAISVTLDVNTGTSEKLVVTNEGATRLTADIALYLDEDPVQSSKSDIIDFGDLYRQKGQADPRQGKPVANGFGGPDDYGYIWIDSDQAGGPAYEFIDIDETGTVLETDDDESVEVTLPFFFSYYGQEYDKVYVNGNGFVSVDADYYQSWNHAQIPLDDNNNGVIAGYWYDLSTPVNGTIKGQAFDDSYVVQWTDVAEYSGNYSETVTFQIVLYLDGTIRFNYKDVENASFINSGTIGIENEDATDGTQIAFNTAYLHNELSVELGPVDPLLSADKSILSLASNESDTITLSASAFDIVGGTYSNTLRITSNDPSTPILDIPVTVIIEGIADVGIPVDSLAFGETFIAGEGTQILEVENPGTGTFYGAISITEGTDYFSTEDATFNVPARSTSYIEVYFNPTTTDTIAGSLQVSDANGALGTFDVALSGYGVTPPTISVDKETFEATLISGEKAQETLTITNDGGATLDFVLGIENEFEQNAAGGPDNYGYKWIDSDDPDGPEFHFIDISETGTALSVSQDDSEEIALPWSFEFYGETYESIFVSANGLLSFEYIEETSWWNEELPEEDEFNAVIAAFWDDLSPEAGGTVVYEIVDDVFIVQFTRVQKRSGIFQYITFQALLYSDGTIQLSYLDVDDYLVNSSTIGIENSTSTDGLMVVYNDDYLHNEMTIEFYRADPEIFVPGNTSVTRNIAENESMEILVNLDASNLNAGEYDYTLRLESNVPDNEELLIPVNIQVTGTPEVHLPVSSWNYGKLPAGLTDSLYLMVENVGTDTLEVSNISLSSESVFTLMTDAFSFTIPPKDQSTLTLVAMGSTAGIFESDLTITSNDEANPSVSASLKVEIVDRGNLYMAMDTLTVPTLAEEMAYDTLIIENVGNASLALESVDFASDWMFHEQDLDWPIDVAAGSTYELPIVLSGVEKTSGTYFGNVAFTTNDPVTDTVDFTLVVELVVTELPVVERTEGLQVVYEGETLSHTFSASDADGDDLVFSLNGETNNASISESGSLTFSPDYTQAGYHLFDVHVSDGVNTVSHMFEVLVRNVNFAPQVASPIEDQRMFTDNGALSIDLYDVFSDPDEDDEITFSVVVSDETVVDASITSLLSFEALAEGQSEVVVFATDLEGLVTSDTFAIDVLGPLGLDDVEDSSITISPNPTTDYVNVMMQNGYTGYLNISLYDMTGRLVKQETFLKNSNEFNRYLNLSDLIHGSYIVTMTDNENHQIKYRIEVR